MAGPSQARADRLLEIVRRIEEVPENRPEVVAWIRETYEISRQAAYRDYAEASRLAGYGVIGDQLVFGALALNGAQRCLVDAESMLRSVSEHDQEGFKWASRRSKAFLGVANSWINLADKCMRLRPTDVMDSDEGRELVIRAVEQHKATLTPEHRARLEAAAKPGPKD